jgi:hypothetical protein
MDATEEVEEIEKGIGLMRSLFLREWLEVEFGKAAREDRLSSSAREFYEEILCGAGEVYFEWVDM